MFNYSPKTQEVFKVCERYPYNTASCEIGNWWLKTVIIWDMKNLQTEKSLLNTGKYNLLWEKLGKEAEQSYRNGQPSPSQLSGEDWGEDLLFLTTLGTNLDWTGFTQFLYLKYSKEFCLSFVKSQAETAILTESKLLNDYE